MINQHLKVREEAFQCCLLTEGDLAAPVDVQGLQGLTVRRCGEGVEGGICDGHYPEET